MFLKVPLCPTACTSGSASIVDVGNKAELKPPGYPYDVPEHLSCRWLLEAPVGQVFDFGLPCTVSKILKINQNFKMD